MQFVKEFLLKLGSKLGWLLKLSWLWINCLLRSDSSLMHTSIKSLSTAKWWEINETHNYTLILKGSHPITQKIYDKCEQVFESIDQQHIDKFGHPKAFLDYWRDLNSLYIKKIKAATKGGSAESHYEYAQIRFDAQYKKSVANNYKLKGMVEKALNLGYRINPDTMPIIEFSSLVELANETVKDV